MRILLKNGENDCVQHTWLFFFKQGKWPQKNAATHAARAGRKGRYAALAR
jgi:hypothetical protein